MAGAIGACCSSVGSAVMGGSRNGAPLDGRVGLGVLLGLQIKRARATPCSIRRLNPAARSAADR